MGHLAPSIHSAQDLFILITDIGGKLLQAKKTSSFMANFDKNELDRKMERSRWVDRDYKLLYNMA